jgi:DNA 3'-phosphatase
MSSENYNREWMTLDSVLFYIPALEDFCDEYIEEKSQKSSKIKFAGFDLDGTLINSSRGGKFSLTPKDYILAYENVVSTLKKYKDDGYCICIISNRKAGIDSKTVKSAQSRIENLFKDLGFECFAFLLTGSDKYRKPKTGSLTLFKTLLSADSFEEGSFYCGDAAKNYSDSPWNQWSDSDYKLVCNWNKSNRDSLEFFTPDDMFGKVVDWCERTDIFINKYPSIQNYGDGLTDKTEIRLVITCGQVSSGYRSKNFESFETPDGLKFTSGGITTYGECPDPDEDVISIVCGSYPTYGERTAIMQKFDLTSLQTLVVWFSRPASEKISRQIEYGFVKTFQDPSTTGEQWIRGN